jgi:hypothetical protein
MAWPPTSNLASNFYQNKQGTGGVVTAAWGTDGLMALGIVKSLQARRDGENIPIEQGSGLVSNMIQLLQGNHFVVSLEDDRNITTWPDFGGNMTITVSPIEPNSTSTSYVCLVLDNAYNAARKANGERTYQVERFSTGIP